MASLILRNLSHCGKVLCLALALTGTAGGFSAALADDPLSESTGSDPTHFPDPVLDKNLVLPATLATAGTANTGSKLSSSPALAGCSPMNPCAMPTPALTSLAAEPAGTQSARPMQAMRKRRARPA